MAQSKLAVIGAGPIGLFQAICLKSRGFDTEVYESREDLRKLGQNQGRSINITLSERGLRCLREFGLEEQVLAIAVKVDSRMIHTSNGDRIKQPYSKNGDGLFSVNRSRLNEILLNEAEKTYGIPIHFEHKLTKVDFHNKKLTFRKTTQRSHVDLTTTVNFIFGCDGVNSVVRKQMRKADGALRCERKKVKHQYKELRLPASPDGNYQLDPNSLHVWPRGESVLLGLPNKEDGTFTMSLFMPKESFDQIKGDTELMMLFESLFPESLDLIGRKNLTNRFFENPTGSLVSLKCSHYATEGAVLLGDAAHAVVPFYGQGTNAGFEDCLLYDQYLKEADYNLQEAALQFSRERPSDGHALAEMSLEHYDVLCKKVDSPLYECQRHLEDYFSEATVDFFPTYTMVAFTDMPYSQVKQQSQRQIAVINDFIFLVNLLEIIYFLTLIN